MEQLPRASVLDSARQGAEQLERTGHSFYPDLLIPSRGEMSLLLVMDRRVARSVMEHLPDSLPLFDDVAVLITAPRHSRADAATVARGVPGGTARVPVIFLRQAEQTRWTVAVPGVVTPFWVVQPLATSTSPPVASAQLSASRLGFGPRDETLRAALEQGLPAVRLDVTDPAEVPGILDEVRQALREIEVRRSDDSRNYLLIPLTPPLFLVEFQIILFLIFIATALLLYTLSRPRRVSRYLRSMRHNLPAILISLAVLVISLMAANLTIRLAGRFYPVGRNPVLLGLGKISLGIMVMGILAITLQHRIRRITAVYSGVAILVLLAAVVVASSNSIILGFYFSVSFVFGVVFSFGRGPLIKSVAYLLSLLPVVYIIAVLASVADTAMSETILTPPLQREVVTAIMLLPALLMLFRLDTLTPRLPLVPFMTMFAVVGVALVVATLVNAAGEADLYHLRVTSRFPGDAAVLLEDIPREGMLEVISTTEAGQPPEPLVIRPGDSEGVICQRLPCQGVIAPAPPPPVALETGVRRALDRHTLTWGVTTTRNAGTVRIRLETDRPVQLYAADATMEQPLGSRGTRFTVETGPDPPDSFGGSVVLRADALPVRVTATVIARFPGAAVPTGPQVAAVDHREEWTIRSRQLLE